MSWVDNLTRIGVNIINSFSYLYYNIFPLIKGDDPDYENDVFDGQRFDDVLNYLDERLESDDDGKSRNACFKLG